MKYHRQEALELIRKTDIVLVAKGKKLLRFELAGNVTDDDLAAVALGRSGTLRAPAISIGNTFIVGYHADGYQEIFG